MSATENLKLSSSPQFSEQGIYDGFTDPLSFALQLGTREELGFADWPAAALQLGLMRDAEGTPLEGVDELRGVVERMSTAAEANNSTREQFLALLGEAAKSSVSLAEALEEVRKELSSEK